MRPRIQRQGHSDSPGDVYEREADAVADKIMRMGETRPSSSATPPIQRKEIKEHGVLKDVPDDVSAACDRVGDPAPGLASEQKIPGVQYAIESDKIEPVIESALNHFARDWHTRGANEKVDIFGYASIDGPEFVNWTLSCKRANSVKNILLHPTDGSPGLPSAFVTTHAEGETDKFGASQADLVPNRVATIVSTVPLKPVDPCPPCPRTVIRPDCPPCPLVLPHAPFPDQPPGLVKPKGSPFFFCEPYIDMVDAFLSWTITKLAIHEFTSKWGSEVQDLWAEYLNNPKKGTKGTLPPRKLFASPTGRIVTAFREDPETDVQKTRIMKLIAARVRADPKLMPAEGKSTPLLGFRPLLNDADLLNLPMAFKDPANKIPGNLAGGFGKNSSDAGDDVRNVDGSFIATNRGAGILAVAATFSFDVLDAVDFCPGAAGGFWAQQITIPMSRFEATPDFPTYDIPFEVVYSLKDEFIS
jgi:outer membrane protein OmpA-like peptidoglycan-associated protein